jgi:hypothetical protein
MRRRRASALAAVVAVLLVAGCGGDGDGGSKDAEAILREYAQTARELVEGWPPPQAAPEIARLSLDAQQPRVDSVGRLADRAQSLADGAKGEQAAAYGALAAAMQTTHADLARKLAVIGRDEYWALDFYCSGLDQTLAAAKQQAAAVDAVIVQLGIDAPPDILSRDGGALATAARCRDAVNEAAKPLASPSGGFVAGMDERADHVRAAYGQLQQTLGGLESSEAVVNEGRDALRALVDNDIALFDAARAFHPAAGQSAEDSATAFKEANQAALDAQVKNAEAWQRASQRIVAAAQRNGS